MNVFGTIFGTIFFLRGRLQPRKASEKSSFEQDTLLTVFSITLFFNNFVLPRDGPPQKFTWAPVVKPGKAITP